MQILQCRILRGEWLVGKTFAVTHLGMEIFCIAMGWETVGETIMGVTTTSGCWPRVWGMGRNWLGVGCWGWCLVVILDKGFVEKRVGSR